MNEEKIDLIFQASHSLSDMNFKNEHAYFPPLLKAAIEHGVERTNRSPRNVSQAYRQMGRRHKTQEA